MFLTKEKVIRLNAPTRQIEHILKDKKINRMIKNRLRPELGQSVYATTVIHTVFCLRCKIHDSNFAIVNIKNKKSLNSRLKVFHFIALSSMRTLTSCHYTYIQ